MFYRDVAHILQNLLNVLFYITPIIYSVDLIPAKYRWIFRLNPLEYIFNGFRLSVYWGKLPTIESVIACFVCAIVVLVLGYWMFKKHEDEFVFYV